MYRIARFGYLTDEAYEDRDQAIAAARSYGRTWLGRWQAEVVWMDRSGTWRSAMWVWPEEGPMWGHAE